MAREGLHFAAIVLWIVAGALQYGYHISALNSSQESLMCTSQSKGVVGLYGLPTCIPMTTFDFGVLTSIFTFGGLIASLNAGRLADERGRKGTALVAAWLVIIGGTAMTFGSSFRVLVMGRFVIGLSCGISTVLVPLFVSEVSPAAITGKVGVLTQLSICSGILLAQGISIPLSKPDTGNWRIISLVSASLAVIQVVTAAMMIESPKWLSDKGRSAVIYDVPEPEPTHEDTEAGAQDRLLSSEWGNEPADNEESLTLRQAFESKEETVKKGFRVVVLTQFFQQLSGINAVMYYSTGILSAIVKPAAAKYVALSVTLVNLVMTFPAIYLIDHLGRRQLILISLGTMSISSLVLARSINTSSFAVASTSIIAFVGTFSLGLGPVPWSLVGDYPPQKARSATASAGMGTNWILNLFVGLFFLPVRDWMSGGIESSSGNVFYLFAAVSAIGFVVIGRLLA